MPKRDSGLWLEAFDKPEFFRCQSAFAAVI